MSSVKDEAPKRLLEQTRFKNLDAENVAFLKGHQLHSNPLWFEQ